MADNEFSDVERRLVDIFHPYAMAKVREARENNTRFVHYTTAVAAMNILKSKEVWLRNILSMNDYMEVRQGLNCLYRAYDGDVGEQFRSALNGLFDKLAEEIAELFRGWMPYIENDTYIACLSEHTVCEDEHGLLPMWRAYGKSTGVALVLNNTSILADSAPLGVYSSPVEYFSDLEFEHELQRIVQGIRGNENFLRDQGRQTIIGSVEPLAQ